MSGQLNFAPLGVGLKLRRDCRGSPQVLQRHRAKLQRVSSEDRRPPFRGQAVKQSTEMRSVLDFIATAQSFCGRSLQSVQLNGAHSSHSPSSLSCNLRVGHGGPRVSEHSGPSRASHGGNWPPFRGRDGQRSSTWYCWQGGWHSSQSGTSRTGDQHKDWRATDPKTSGHQPEDLAGRGYFLTLSARTCSS